MAKVCIGNICVLPHRCFLVLLPNNINVYAIISQNVLFSSYMNVGRYKKVVFIIVHAYRRNVFSLFMKFPPKKGGLDQCTYNRIITNTDAQEMFLLFHKFEGNGSFFIFMGMKGMDKFPFNISLILAWSFNMGTCCLLHSILKVGNIAFI